MSKKNKKACHNLRVPRGLSEPTSPQTRFMASSGVVPPRKRTDPKEKRIFPCGTIHGTMPARLNLIRHRHPGAVRGHQELSFSNENGAFRSRRRRLCLICGMGGIRTHVPHLWDNSISSRARCDRFDTFPLRRRPDQPARQAFGPSYEKTHISLCASFLEIYGVSKQIRTALSDVRGRCPNRIDDGDVPHV